MANQTRNTLSLINRFLEAKLEANLSPKTISDYAGLLKRFEQKHPTLPLTSKAVSGFVHEVSKGKSERTRYDYWCILRIFYRWLARQHLIAQRSNPFLGLDPPRVRKKLPRVLTEQQLRDLIEVSKAPFERALTLVLIDGGPRIGELVGRTKSDMVPEGLRVHGKTGDRIVVLSEPVLSYLRELPTHNLFPSRLGWQPGSNKGVPFADKASTVGRLKKTVRSVMRRAGITGPKTGPHTLRHSFATHYLSRSKDLEGLSRLLGHSSLHQSQQYLAMDLEGLVKSHRQHSPLVSLMGMRPAAPVAELPAFTLPLNAMAIPLAIEGEPVYFTLSPDRKGARTYYYLRTRVGRSSKGIVAKLGEDLPLDYLDAANRVIAEENERRRREFEEALAS